MPRRWPKRSAPLRSAVFHILTSDELDGVLCSSRDLVAPLNALAAGRGGEGDDGEHTSVDPDLILESFRGSEREFLRSYRDLKILLREGGEEDHYLLYRFHRTGTERGVCEFARFARSEGEDPPSWDDAASLLRGPASRETMVGHPLDRTETVRRIADAVPEPVRADLAEFLKEERLRRREQAAAGEAKAAETATKGGRSKNGSRAQPQETARTTAPVDSLALPAVGAGKKQRGGRRAKFDQKDAPAPGAQKGRTANAPKHAKKKAGATPKSGRAKGGEQPQSEDVANAAAAAAAAVGPVTSPEGTGNAPKNATKKAGPTSKSRRAKGGGQPQSEDVANAAAAAAAAVGPVTSPEGTGNAPKNATKNAGATSKRGKAKGGGQPQSEDVANAAAAAADAAVGPVTPPEGTGNTPKNATKKAGATSKSGRAKGRGQPQSEDVASAAAAAAAAIGSVTPPEGTGEKQRRSRQGKLLDPKKAPATDANAGAKGSLKADLERSKRNASNVKSAELEELVAEAPEPVAQKGGMANAPKNATKKAGATSKSGRTKGGRQPQSEDVASAAAAAAVGPVSPPEGTGEKQRRGRQGKLLDPKEAPATDANAGAKGSLKTDSERAKRDASNVKSAELEALVAELRRELSESERKSEARKRTAALHQAKCQALQKDFQETKVAAAEREEELLAAAADLQKTSQSLVDELKQKLHNAESESKARQRSLVSCQTENHALQSQVQDLQTTLEQERELRRQREEDLIRPLEESKRDLTQALEKAMAELRAKDDEIQKLTASLKRSEMLRPSQKPGEVSNKKIAKLQRELQETQAKLLLERKKNSTSTGSAATKRTEPRSKLELKDWIAPRPGGDTGLEVLKPGDPVDSAAVKARGAVTEPDAKSSTLSERAEAIARESAPISFSGLEGDEGNGTVSRLDDELAFLASAYSSDEINVEDGKITRALKLGAGEKGNHLRVNLMVRIPEEYPESGILKISGALAAEHGHCNKDVWKCAENALSGLVDACKWEAEGCAGSEALLSVLNIADDWVQNQWEAVHARRFLSSTKVEAEGEGDFRVCSLLVYTHHIVDSEKIHFVKQTASKHNLGGFIKVGRPGIIVVEGLEENCDSFYQKIVLQRKKMRESNKGKPDSSTFSEAGKVFYHAKDLASGRRLPEKIAQLENCSEGMERVKVACEAVGLKVHLEEACKR